MSDNEPTHVAPRPSSAAATPADTSPPASSRGAYIRIAVAVVGIIIALSYGAYRIMVPATKPGSTAASGLPGDVSSSDQPKGAAVSSPDRGRPGTVVAGFTVTEAPEQTPGFVAGLRPGDIITAYDGEIVASDISYKYAREQRSRAGAREAELTVHRGGQVIRLSVPTGLLGFDGFDCTDLMDRINTAYFAGNVTEAERLLTEGLASKALGHAEELVGRIWLIPDDTTPVEEARRDSLLNELGSMCLTSDLPGFAQTYFYRRGHFVAAAALNRRYLALDPDNVSVRLNLALCEAIANRFDQADRDVHMVLDREDAGVSPYGYGVACTICGYVEFGRKNYKQSARYFHDAVELTNPVDDWRLQNRYLVAAANVGLPAFRAARDHVVSIEPSGSSFVSWNAKVLECYALAVAGNREEAIQIAHCFPRALPPGLLFELRTFPEGADVVARWDSLWP